MTKGQVDFGFNGLAQNEYGWWYVSGGKIDFAYTGLAQNENGWWYVRNGKVDFTFSDDLLLSLIHIFTHHLQKWESQLRLR